jgi:hypothetical protein
MRQGILPFQLSYFYNSCPLRFVIILAVSDLCLA